MPSVVVVPRTPVSAKRVSCTAPWKASSENKGVSSIEMNAFDATKPTISARAPSMFAFSTLNRAANDVVSTGRPCPTSSAYGPKTQTTLEPPANALISGFRDPGVSRDSPANDRCEDAHAAVGAPRLAAGDDDGSCGDATPLLDDSSGASRRVAHGSARARRPWWGGAGAR